MGKILWLGLVLTLLLSGCGQKEEGEMDAVQSRAERTEHGTIQYLSIVTNTGEVEDWEACAREVIERCVNNDFQTILLSYEGSGYPIELHAEVYLTKEDMKNGDAVFLMDYEQDETGGQWYNIKENPEKFSLELKAAPVA